MSQNKASIDDFEEAGEALVRVIRSCKVDDNQRLLRDKIQAFHDQQLDIKNTVTQMLNDIVQCEEREGQRLLDQKSQKSQSERELEGLEEELRLCTIKSQNMDSELQFLQRELEDLRGSEQELQALQEEVDEDTTEVIPTATYIAQLYHKVTRIKWEYDSEPHILRGVHYGAELATPINIDTSVRPRWAVSDDLWAFVSTEWETGQTEG